MRRPTVLLIAATLLCGATAAFAQPANFAGHWVQEVLAGTRAGPPDGGGPPPPVRASALNAGTFGPDFAIVMDGKVMTVRRLDTTYGDTLNNVFNLDGSESKNAGLFGGGTNPGPTTSTAKWDGNKLVITMVGTGTPPRGGGPPPGTSTTTMFMVGKQMRMESVRPPTNGGSETSILSFFNLKK